MHWIDKKDWTMLATLVAVLALAPGCKKGNNIVGKWQITGGSFAKANVTASQTFNQDGTMEVEATVPKPPMTVKYLGTYKVDGDMLSVVFQSASVHATDPETDKAIEPNRKTAEQNALETAQKENKPDQITWVDEDQFTSQEVSGQMSWHRVKP